MADAETVAVPLAGKTLAAPANPLPAAKTHRRRRSLLASYLVLGKARLSATVVMTTGLGFIIGARQVDGFDFPKMLWTCLGTFLAAIGAAAFNQALEARRDARMLRTRNRPIPAGDLSAAHAAFFALLISIAGIAILCPTSNGLTALLGFATIILYVLVYTPMKTASTANTLVGAVVGGIPPIMGWTAATGSLAPGALVLGTILFIWQIPHFLALAWKYREDYARAGYKMVPTVEPTGRLTGLLCILYSLALIPACLAVVYLNLAGMLFGILSAVMGAGLTLLAIRFARSRSNLDARRLFLATLIYLPILCIIMVLNAKSPYDGLEKSPAGWVRYSTSTITDPGR